MLTVIILFLLGLSAGSFINAAVWRMRQTELRAKSLESRAKKGKKLSAKDSQLSATDLSILRGRSMCPHCRHTLAWYDLVPLVSWLLLRGRCRYCKKPISIQYPVVELIGGLVFGASYLLWPGGVYGVGDWLLLITWLTSSVGLLALAVYDIRWMLLPNRIIYPTLAVATAGRAGYIAAFVPNPGRAVGMWVLSVAIASGIFYLLFMISGGKWIGFGDVRLGLITGTLLAHPTKAVAMIFIASVIGTLVATPDLLKRKKTMISRIPYGPFLIAGTVAMVLWGDTLLEQYSKLFGL